MTQSDIDFVSQIVENRFPEPPVRMSPTAILASWYSILIAGALLTGAVIGLAG